MRHSNINLAHGTKGNPQETIEQQETQIKSEKLEQDLINYKRNLLLKSVKTEKARMILSELYRPGSYIGDGGTADMLIYESSNIVDFSKKNHYQKAQDRLKEINKVLTKNQAPGDEDILTLEKIKLERAIEIWEKANGK